MDYMVYRVLGMYRSNDSRNREIVYSKIFESLDEALIDFYRIIDKNTAPGEYSAIYNEVLQNYKGNIRYAYIETDTHCDETSGATLTVEEIKKPKFYKCEPIFAGGSVPVPQIEFDDRTILSRISYLPGINDMELHFYSGYLSIEDILFEDGLKMSDPETLNKIVKVSEPWTVEDVRKELKKLYVERF